MKQYLSFTKRCLLLIAPAIASSMLATSPSQAATFAFSQGVLEFTGFSQSPSSVGTGTRTNTLTIARDGMANALANAAATFIVAPPTASNLSLSVARGEGRDYLGLAESEATVIGNFVVDAGKSFSFDFNANLNLQSAVDNPLAENARATGDISWALIANDSIIDSFSLMGTLITPGDSDFIVAEESGNVTLSNSLPNFSFGGNQEFATASVQGSLQRSFANQTTLTLVEVKKNRATVKAPEPSTSLALLFSCGVIGVALKGRRKEKTSACSLEGNVAAEV
ncbi:MAG: hypothetical protein ICV78_06060 [Tolypothrix sp. Co-bin9]|nr:hypothetical protein [Tolypothrix sp. Co-bin9]